MRVALAAFLVACGARTELGGVIEISTSDSSIDASTTPPPDFAWYKLDETSGSIAHDSTPHHFDVDVGGVAWGNGATFDRQCGEVDVAPAFRVPPVTITAWLTPALRSDEDSNTYVLTPFPPDALSGDVPSLGGFGVGLDTWSNGGGGAALAAETGVDAPIAFHTISAPVTPGTRHFVVVVTEVSGATLYVDGGLLTTTSADTPPATSPAPLHLGCHNDDDGYGTKRFYEGAMRDVRVYTRLVGASEIGALFAAGPV
jgi:hypothetical protein